MLLLYCVFLWLITLILYRMLTGASCASLPPEVIIGCPHDSNSNLFNEIFFFPKRVMKTIILRIQTDPPLEWARRAPPCINTSAGVAYDSNGRIFRIHFPAVVKTEAGSLFWRMCTHFVLLCHEYWAGLISLLAVVNPLHLQRRSARASGGAELWSSVPSDGAAGDLVSTSVAVYVSRGSLLLHRRRTWGGIFSVCAPSVLWICKQSSLTTERLTKVYIKVWLILPQPLHTVENDR